MIAKNEYLRFYHKARLLDILQDGRGKSINKLQISANMNATLAYVIVEEMHQENLVEYNYVGRSKWITITKKGRQYLKEFDDFINIIETLNR